jgi:hypothetical protein
MKCFRIAQIDLRMQFETFFVLEKIRNRIAVTRGNQKSHRVDLRIFRARFEGKASLAPTEVRGLIGY